MGGNPGRPYSLCAAPKPTGLTPSKNIGGGTKTATNPDSTKRVLAKIESGEIQATFAGKVLASAPMNAGLSPAENAKNLDDAVNAIDPDFTSAEEGTKDEAWNDPDTFIADQSGSTDFGEINQDIANVIKRQPGKIRLQVGEHLGKNKGYGLIHIKEGHPEITNPAEFVKDVVSNFSEIWKTKNSRLILVKRGKDKSGLVSVVQLVPDDEGDFYSVVTAYKSRNPDGETLLWDATHSHPADSGIQPALQSDHHEASDDRKSAEQKEDISNIMIPSEKSSEDNNNVSVVDPVDLPQGPASNELDLSEDDMYAREDYLSVSEKLPTARIFARMMVVIRRWKRCTGIARRLSSTAAS
ncbi:hypothetical protein [Candidatus Methylomicrobium oryzae]|uniref:hypothetical protein n=1 Tax=Candidatus Methylomicrobium oryzae TaxID=2802053 RepID=UPI0019209C37|nr:hypothetical protein [Methylomicrobium sp. RS1]MBL1262065.1 hypothetical protein [Methylomicrobium sp. RS1]